MESTLYEDDFLSAVFDDRKDDFCSNQPFYPNLKEELDSSPLNLSPLREELCKAGREGGNPEEDEGFEDFVEEEISEALQKDCDPTLAGSSTFNEDCKPEQLDLFSMIGTEANEMLVSAKPFTSPTAFPDEILDFDQGVAMESDHQSRHSTSIFADCDIPFDLPFSSPPPTSSAMNIDPLSSPRFLSPPPAPPSNNIPFTTNNVPTINNHSSHTTTYRQNSELDLICSMIQSETQQQPYTTFPQVSSNHCPAPTSIPIDSSNGMDLINLLTSTVEPVQENFNSFPTPPLISNNETCKLEDILPQGCGGGPHAPLTMAGVTNLGGFSPRFSESSHYSDSRQGTPPPTTQFLPPSPVSSVTTDCSEPDFGKDFRHVASKPNTTEDSTKIVNMPFYEFKKILDCPAVPERDKEQAKVIRKRGKNKVAAKHCRQRKVEVIMGLQQEVEKLKGFKASLLRKAIALQRKIEEDKKRVGHYSQRNVLHTQMTV